ITAPDRFGERDDRRMKKRRNGDGRRRREEPDLGAFSEYAPPAPPIDPGRTLRPGEDAAANGGECGEDQNDLAGDKARKAGKSKGERSDPKPSKAGEGGGPDRAEKQRRKEKKDARRQAPTPDEADEEEEEEESDDEMGPELESLLSTLTPAQILLLNGNARPSLPLEDDEDGENGVDPLSIVGDLTAPHRARALLSSIIAPSQISAAEFYDKHWGKRPLLACLEDGSEVGEGAGGRGGAGRGGRDTRGKPRDPPRRPAEPRVDRRHDEAEQAPVRPGPERDSVHRLDGERRQEPHHPRPGPDAPQGRRRRRRPGVRRCQPVRRLVERRRVVVHATPPPTARARRLGPLPPQPARVRVRLEGYKRWKVYAPFNKRETLPRESSRDYTEKEIEDAEETSEAMTCVLGPGDILYLPRGWVHQAETVARPAYMPRLPGVKDDHSLHLTVSAMQNWCWADYLEILMPGALDAAVGSDKTTALREGLPRNFLEYMGTMNQVAEEGGGGADLPDGLKSDEGPDGHGDDDGEAAAAAAAEARSRRRTRRRQREFRDEAKKRIMRVCKQAMTMLDDACDEMGKRHMSDRLPPALLGPERGPDEGRHRIRRRRRALPRGVQEDVAQHTVPPRTSRRGQAGRRGRQGRAVPLPRQLARVPRQPGESHGVRGGRRPGAGAAPDDGRAAVDHGQGPHPRGRGGQDGDRAGAVRRGSPGDGPCRDSRQDRPDWLSASRGVL
ncbi:hypothetical protein THAOC_09906, partial [Thalassiosira oceanica]